MAFNETAVLTTQDLHEYLSFTKDVLDNGDATRSYRLTALKSYYKYYVKINPRIEKDPAEDIPAPKRSKVLPKYLNEEEAIKLLLTCCKDEKNKCFESVRDYCMITLMLNCGMRLSELIGIDVSALSLTESEHSLRLFGKGRKERIVYLNEACLNSVTDYLEWRLKVKKLGSNPALFVSERTGSRLTQRRVQQILDNRLLEAGLEDRHFSPHKLRHTAATLMYQNGGDVLVIKEILGHENIGTTQIYTHLGNSQVREAMEHSPLAKFDPSKKE